MSVPELGYWKIRGLGEPIRYLLKYVGQDFKDTMYEQGDAPEFSRESWLTVKKDIPMDFPNLPYFFHENVKISETFAIMRYIAQKWNPELLGKNVDDQSKLNELQGVLYDVKMQVTMPCYMQGEKSVVQKAFMNQLPKISKFLGEKQFLLGDYVTVLDFYFFEILECAEYFTEGNAFQTFQNFAGYSQRIKELKGVKDHIQNCETYKMKFNNKVAKVNN